MEHTGTLSHAGVDRPGAGWTDADVVRLRGDLAVLRADAWVAVDDVLRRVAVLCEDLGVLDPPGPVERVVSRVKSAASIVSKAQRRGIGPSSAALRAGVTDVAGVRLVCTSRDDLRPVLDAMLAWPDVCVLSVDDYLARPGASGYRSLHVVLEVPVLLRDGPELFPVEIQVRSVVMDLWAEMQHPVYRAAGTEALESLRADLREAAALGERLDRELDRLRAQIGAWVASGAPDDDGQGSDRQLA